MGEWKVVHLLATMFKIPNFNTKDGEVILGFRAEDAIISDTESEINGPVYTIELLGDATMITVKAGDTLVSAKAPKDFRIEIGAMVSISVPKEICHLFDWESHQNQTVN